MVDGTSNAEQAEPKTMRAFVGGYWRLFMRHRLAVFGFPLALALCVAGGTLLLPNIYRGEVLLAPPSLDSDADVRIPGLGGLESLVGLTGIALPNGGNSDVNLAVLRSRDFVTRFIVENDLMPILYEDEWDAAAGRWIDDDPDDQPSLWDAYRLFTRRILDANEDQLTGLVRVGIEWRDPEIAAQWANQIVDLLNQHQRSRAIERSRLKLSYLEEAVQAAQVTDIRQSLYALIENEQRTAMLVNTQKDYAFRIIDPAVVPDRKVSPQRALLTILAGILGGMLALGYVVFWTPDSPDRA